MNIKKLSKRLNKINLLFQSIKEEGSASSIEKDLLLSYLREAYEYATEDTGSSPAPRPKPTPQKQRYEEPAVHVPTSTPTPAAKVMEQIVQEEILPEPPVEQVTTAATPATPPAPEPVVETVTATVATPAAPVSDALSAVFAQADVSELSDRLSMARIADMTKSMGINEKIFTVKELFGGDSDLFNSIMTKINGFANYDEASQYLKTGIARDQDWGHESKIKKAEAFIKLVKRRFV